MTPQQEARLKEALRHVEMGFAVMSVWSTEADGTCKCLRGADCTSPGKHPIPRDGFKAGSLDIKRVTTMMSAASEPNYGIVWPEASPKGVVFEWDVDGDDWKERIEALKAQFGPLPPTKTTKTPHGGLHIFYRWPDGVPIPSGNQFHGFVVRWPWRGYVVGPGSAINGTAYRDVGTAEIADLPPSWAVLEPVPAGRVRIEVAGEDPGYELPESVGPGERHNALIKYAGHLWNRNRDMTAEDGWSKAERELLPRFTTLDGHPPDYYHEHFVNAWNDAQRRWERPDVTDGEPIRSQTGGSTSSGADSGSTAEGHGSTSEGHAEDTRSTGAEQTVVIDPLAIESHIERPEAVNPHALPLPIGLAMLLDHYRPLTDAPYSSLLLASCVTMSALVGNVPRLRWRGDNHAALFGVLVGDSGYGRKGATMRVVSQTFMQVDPLLRDITVSGVGSGESFIDLLNESQKNSLGTVLIREHEIAGMLTIANREGSTLSPILRMAWDGDPVMTRSRAKGVTTAKDYNAAFLGGVTPGELKKRLDDNDLANGYANRFLWFYSEKRDDPFDPGADDTLDPNAKQWLSDCIQFARTMGGSMLIRPRYPMSLTPEADERLHNLAVNLDVRPVGPIGALRTRMAGHAIRVAMVAALFDQSAVVDEHHVAFGIAMAGYAVDSMRAVFGVRIDDPVAMLILGVLQQAPGGWLNTTTLKQVTGKEYSRVTAALRVLIDAGLIVREDRPTGGRPAIGYALRKG